MDPQQSVYIAVLNQGDIRTELLRWILTVDRNCPYKVMWDFPSEKPIANNRNQIVQRFLESGCDYLMQIDDDIIPPPDAMELLDCDVDVITPLMFAHRRLKTGYIGLVPLILQQTDYPDEPTEEQKYLNEALGLPALIESDKDVNYNVIGSDRGEDYSGRGLVECDATGTGCMIVKRQVLENENMKAPFLDIFDDETGERTLGLDINFCRRAQKEGYNIYVHTDYVASHWTDMDQKMLYQSLNDGISITQLGEEKVA